MSGHSLFQLLDGSHAMRHVWLVPLKKRQQREAHGDNQQGHLDNAGHRLVFNAWANQVFLDVIADLIVDRRVSALGVCAQKIHN